MGQKVNPNVLRLGKTKDWNYKYNEKKSTDYPLYTFKHIEIKKFINKFFKDNGLIVSNCKLNYSDNNLYIFISYYLVLESNFLINKKLTQKPSVKYYKIFKHTTRVFNYQIKKKKQFYKSKKKLYKIRKIKFLQYSNFYEKKMYNNTQKSRINSFLKKFTESLKNFINKKELKIILNFQQLNKKNKLNLTKKKSNFIQEKLSELRLFEKNPFFYEGLNVFFTLTKNNKSTELLADFIVNQLKQLKKNHNFFLKFLKTGLTVLNSKTINSNIDGIKIKIKGKFNKAARAKHKVIIIGAVPLFSITSNIHYSERISYNSNGTFGIKIWAYKTI